jgi:aryl-alcohol dehydrogenase-like predicted oxidoreductase
MLRPYDGRVGQRAEKGEGVMTGHKVTRRGFVQTSAVAAAGVAAGVAASQASAAEKKKILNYNENMEYRRCGKTNLMVSAVSLGGHWKRINVMKQDFDKNRHDVVSRCIDVGINYLDACCRSEVCAYSRALKGRRDKMYLALSYCGKETRNKDYRTAKKLLECFDALLSESNQEYTDLWRITCFEPGGRHTFNTSCELVEALEKAKKQGKARFIGFSSHDRRWIKMMIEYFPQIEVICMPYTAKTKQMPEDSVFDALKKCDVGFFGIKPFASNSLFKGDSSPDSPHAREDDRRARLAIRYILCNPIITAPIPGLISIPQVDNMAKAVMERRQLDLAERRELDKAMDEAWANLPKGYDWLKDWEYA